MKILMALILSSSFSSALAGSCEDWFKELKIKSKKDCELICLSAKVDMATFTCHNRCEPLCEAWTEEQPYTLLDLYPGLNDEEKKLCNSEKANCVQAYLLSWEAEALCHKLYKKSLTDDESDACRHYVWARIMSADINSEFAEKVLTAHEAEPGEPQNQRAMDLANNRLALSRSATDKVKKISKSRDEIIEEFKKSLKDKELVILKDKPSNRR